MIDFDALREALGAAGLDEFWESKEALVSHLMSKHGDFPEWRGILEKLSDLENDPAALKQALLGLAPWRKGPFDVGGVHIDAEWRSDIKWARLADAIALKDRTVLDVGCGNGYYAFRMREAGARIVVGIDPTALYVIQFLAVNHFRRDPRVFVLPLRLETWLPPVAMEGSRVPDCLLFDTTFSMGVLYHQRSPIDHLRQLRRTLRPGGQLVLETIFVPGEESYACTPSDRYARMKNVWLLPTLAELENWLGRTGYRDVEIVDRSTTTTDEQRTTEWMPYESLAEALDPNKPGFTVEGWPAPHRVVVTATSP